MFINIHVFFSTITYYDMQLIVSDDSVRLHLLIPIWLTYLRDLFLLIFVRARTSVHSLILAYFHASGRVQFSSHCHVSLYLVLLSRLFLLSRQIFIIVGNCFCCRL